eukprot:1158396-Pelagomonas_calceolata.AAC.2
MASCHLEDPRTEHKPLKAFHTKCSILCTEQATIFLESKRAGCVCYTCQRHRKTLFCRNKKEKGKKKRY